MQLSFFGQSWGRSGLLSSGGKAGCPVDFHVNFSHSVIPIQIPRKSQVCPNLDVGNKISTKCRQYKVKKNAPASRTHLYNKISTFLPCLQPTTLRFDDFLKLWMVTIQGQYPFSQRFELRNC